jgi:predicted dehydrogenase
MKRTINWAIVGTGGISNSFIKGLKDAEGAVPLAAVSGTRERAESFAATYGMKKYYAGFDAMLEDREIDVVYLGVPHTAHKALAIKAFNAGKAVLCEKPAAINAGELREMIQAARENKVFFMEALWTRFVPPVVQAREWLAEGLIGEARMVQGNFCFRAPFDPAWRLYNRALGGGALLDAGIYPISLSSMVFGGRRPEKVSSILTVGETGVDEETAALLSWGPHKTAVITVAITTAAQNDLWIYGAKGRIQLPSFVSCRSATLAVDGEDPRRWEGEFRGNGYNYQAEAVMDCVREGALESAVMPLDESLNIARTMDEIRAQWDFKYPSEEIE